jgi:hypothetical protein
MLIVVSKSGVPIRLSQERWGHVVRRHPEMEGQKEKVLETVTEPDTIYQGDFDECLAVRLYPKTPLTRKHLVVVYRETSHGDGFILTAYFATEPSKRRKPLWMR